MNYNDLNKKLVLELIERKLKISAAESCTGGMFISSLIDIPNSSKVIEESYVTYSIHAKSKILGIDENYIDKFGVVSREVAYMMAKRVKDISKSDIGVAFTGYAGPSSDPLTGLVHMAIAYNDKVYTFYEHIKNKTRNEVRHEAVLTMLMKILEVLEEC